MADLLLQCFAFTWFTENIAINHHSSTCRDALQGSSVGSSRSAASGTATGGVRGQDPVATAGGGARHQLDSSLHRAHGSSELGVYIIQYLIEIDM